MRTEFGRAYVHQDANWNVIGLTDITGRSLERYYYSPYGELEAVRDAHFFDYDDDGDVDSADNTALTACIGGTSGDCLLFDADADGAITQDDADAFSSYTATLTTNTELQRIPATTSGSLGNPFGHRGRVYDSSVQKLVDRSSYYDPRLCRTINLETQELAAAPALSYIGGMNRYSGDIVLLKQTQDRVVLGNTSCNGLSGEPQIEVNTTDYSSHCVFAHEYVHYIDEKSCCSKFTDEVKADCITIVDQQTGAGKLNTACYLSKMADWNGWVTDNTPLMECRADIVQTACVAGSLCLCSAAATAEEADKCMSDNLSALHGALDSLTASGSCSDATAGFTQCPFD